MEQIEIRVLVSVVGNDPGNGQSFSYGMGFQGAVPSERAKALVKAGHAIFVGQPEARETATAKTFEKRKK